jgi:predicted outer membrane protein
MFHEQDLDRRGGAFRIRRAYRCPRRRQTPSTQEFVTKVAISDMFEVQASQLALAKQADADTKPFAEKMVTDHQKSRISRST